MLGEREVRLHATIPSCRQIIPKHPNSQVQHNSKHLHHIKWTRCTPTVVLLGVSAISRKTIYFPPRLPLDKQNILLNPHIFFVKKRISQQQQQNSHNADRTTTTTTVEGKLCPVAQINRFKLGVEGGKSGVCGVRMCMWWALEFWRPEDRERTKETIKSKAIFIPTLIILYRINMYTFSSVGLGKATERASHPDPRLPPSLEVLLAMSPPPPLSPSLYSFYCVAPF